MERRDEARTGGGASAGGGRGGGRVVACCHSPGWAASSGPGLPRALPVAALTVSRPPLHVRPLQMKNRKLKFGLGVGSVVVLGFVVPVVRRVWARGGEQRRDREGAVCVGGEGGRKAGEGETGGGAVRRARRVFGANSPFPLALSLFVSFRADRHRVRGTSQRETNAGPKWERANEGAGEAGSAAGAEQGGRSGRGAKERGLAVTAPLRVPFRLTFFFPSPPFFLFPQQYKTRA